MCAALILPAAAEAKREARSELAAYAQGRAADSLGAPGEAAQSYAAALALAPKNEVLAARTFRQALAAGDRPLALRAIRLLERAGGKLSPDARMLLVAEALRTRDWKGAALQIDRIGQDPVFSFVAPILRAWLALDSGRGDPLAILADPRNDPLARAYVAEHRPLLLLAAGHRKEGIAELSALAEGGAGRSSRLRIAAAALLAGKGDRDSAKAMLQGDAAPVAAARALLESGKRIPAPIDDASAGIAELLVRIALDLHAQKATELATGYARLATFLAPDNSETWLVASELLALREHRDEALAALARVRPDDPFAATAADSRIKLLVAKGDRQAALDEAEAATRRPRATLADWTRLGDLYGELERQGEAADAYGRALELARQGQAQQAEWGLWLLRGGALHEAGRWPEAKAALQAAYKLAPDQPVVLNYLGYAQLERREDLDEAERLIREASRLQPDSPAITDSLGWVHYVRGDVAKAIELLERAAAGEPADPAINEHLGDAYYKAGRRYEARYAWEAALLYAEEKDAPRLRAKMETGLTPATASP